MTNYCLHNEQTVNGLRKITWTFIFRFLSMSPCLHSPCFMSMSPCFHVSISMFPCLHTHVSMSPHLHVHVSTFLEFRKGKTELTENHNFHLFSANGKLPFVCCKRKRKTDIFFAIAVSANVPIYAYFIQADTECTHYIKGHV